MNLELINPRRFRPLLLFIGFIFCMIGLGWWGFREDSSIFMLGMGLIVLAVILEIRAKER